MSAAAVIDVAIVAVLAVAAVVLVRLCRGPHPNRPYLRARWNDHTQAWAAEEPGEVGPDELRFVQDLEAHLKAYGEKVADLYDITTKGDR